MRTALVVLLLALAANAEAPVWTDIGKTPEGWRINIALNKRKMTSKTKLTVPLCIDDAEKHRNCSTAVGDCEEWIVMDVHAGPNTVGDLILKAVCPK